MKYNRILTAALACAMSSLFVGCYDDYEGYSAGAPSGRYDISIIDEGAVVVAKTATEFTVTLVRDTDEKADHSALDVPVEVVGGGLKFPSSMATFAAGKDTTQAVITLPTNMALNTPYMITVSLPSEYVQPYKVNPENLCFVSTTLSKEDYELVGKGTFNDGFWGETEEECIWDVTVEYSPELDTYRVKPAYEDGCPLLFKWNKESNELTLANSTGADVDTWECGLSHPNYGAITANYVEASYDPEAQSFDFLFEWTVSAGSFGEYPVSIVLSE
ncbi:MAG: hypothetical protein IJS20_12770 [Bacteroidales bacterium]|nr:hypothetical protein [Bacteroidales bacterium]